MASGPITAWQIEGENVEAVSDFLFLGSKITAYGDCNHEIRWLLPSKKVMTNLESVLKSRGISLLTRVHIVKAMVFPEVTYGSESWTVMKAERQRIDAFELWCWRRFLKVPWIARSNQSILREINPEYSLEGLKLKLKLLYFGHLMWTDESLDKSLIMGKTERRSGRGHQRMRWLDGITNAMNMNLGDGEGQGGLASCSPWGHKEGHNCMTEQQQCQEKHIWAGRVGTSQLSNSSNQ